GALRAEGHRLPPGIGIGTVGDGHTDTGPQPCPLRAQASWSAGRSPGGDRRDDRFTSTCRRLGPPYDAPSRAPCIRASHAGSGLLIKQHAMKTPGSRSAAAGPLSPVLSIGLPVRNARETVERCIASVLSQDLAELELIVSDNASDDGTIEMIESYARMDRRVRVSVNPVNIGVQGNMNRVLAAAR